MQLFTRAIGLSVPSSMHWDKTAPIPYYGLLVMQDSLLKDLSPPVTDTGIARYKILKAMR